MFYFAFWLLVIAIIMLLLFGGAAKKVEKKMKQFGEVIFGDEKENGENG